MVPYPHVIGSCKSFTVISPTTQPANLSVQAVPLTLPLAASPLMPSCPLGVGSQTTGGSMFSVTLSLYMPCTSQNHHLNGPITFTYYFLPPYLSYPSSSFLLSHSLLLVLREKMYSNLSGLALPGALRASSQCGKLLPAILTIFLM